MEEKRVMFPKLTLKVFITFYDMYYATFDLILKRVISI